MTHHDDAKRAILARRARFVAAALTSAGLVASAAACSGDTEKDKSDASAGGSGGYPNPCLGAPAGGGSAGSGGYAGTPVPCLGAPAGGGSGGTGGTPQPCLTGGYGGTLVDASDAADDGD